jgi:phage N-6-adenine-methyltransferase
MNDELAALSAPVRRAPVQKPGRSKQDYATPRDFIDAVVKRFGPIAWDLAASVENTVAPCFFDEARNSLIQDWSALGGLLWCNPPFADLEPWAAQCNRVKYRHGWTLLLVPASTGAYWYQSRLVQSAYVLDLAPRLSFDGIAPYPKDLTLACFGFGVVGRGFWRWK